MLNIKSHVDFENKVPRGEVETSTGLEARYRKVFEDSPDSYVFLDTSLRILSCNATFERLSGFPKSELVGKSLHEKFQKIDLERLQKDIEKATESKSSVTYTRESVFHPGRTFETHISVDSDSVRIHSREVTDWKNAEEKFRLLVENSPDAKVIVDELGAIAIVNSQTENLFLRKREDILGQHFFSLVPERFREEYLNLFETVKTSLESGKKHVSIEVICARSDGVEIQVQVSLGYLKTASGPLIISSLRDVTYRKALEREINDKVIQLQSLDKQRTTFLAMLAHELRNPLSPIINAVYLLESKGLGSPKGPELLQVLKRQSSSLVRMVDDLLDVSRASRGVMSLLKKPIAIDDVILRVLETCDPIVRAKDQVLTFKLSNQKTVVDGDEIRLTQILSNLVNNASKFTHERGQIEIEKSIEEGCVVVSVIDNGMGIEPGSLQEIFKPFVQSDQGLGRGFGGLGVGLTLARELAELHGGTCTGSSEGVGRGSRFQLRLPILQHPQILVPAEVETTPSHSFHSRRILLVEDNEDILTTMTDVLSNAGHVCCSVKCGEDALRALEQFTPDVAIVDIGLPGLSGFDLAESIRNRKELSNVRLIALTGYASDLDKSKAKLSGYAFHLLKPVDVSVLLDAICSES